MAWIVVGICVLILLLGGLLRKLRSRRRWAEAVRHRDDFLNAATAGDEKRIREALDGGIPIDVRDLQGDTALHIAYYSGQKEAIANLIAFGADQNLQNHEGLTPSEMNGVRGVEDFLQQGARCLGDRGVWQDVNRGREIYDLLRQYRPRIYNAALVRVVLNAKDPHRTKLVYLAIKVGVTGSEEKLAEILKGYGDVRMATEYLNAGSPILYDAARRWATAHNYRIYHRGGHQTVSWGRF